MCSPVRKAAPSTSVTTVGWPPIGGPTSITRASKTELTIDRCRSVSPDADLAAVVQDRQPGRRAGAARRPIDFAVGEDRDVALGTALALDGLPEDDAVDAREVRLVRVDDLERAIQGGAELALQGDQLGEGSRLDMEPEGPHIHRAVERPAERDVEHQPAPARLDLHVAREHERGDVPEAHRLDPTVAVQARRAGEPARRDVDRDRDLTSARFGRDPTGVDRPGHQRDRPVPARRRIALVVEEHDAQVTVGVVGWRDEARRTCRRDRVAR